MRCFLNCFISTTKKYPSRVILLDPPYIDSAMNRHEIEEDTVKNIADENGDVDDVEDNVEFNMDFDVDENTGDARVLQQTSEEIPNTVQPTHDYFRNLLWDLNRDDVSQSNLQHAIGV